MKSSDVKKLREVFKNSGSILLTTHRNPDGDGIGSGLALMRSLKSMGKHVDFVTRDPVPAIYSFLPLSEKVINLAEVKKHYDLIVFLECPDADRCGRIIDYKKYGKLTVNIDHHLGNEMYADVNVVEPTAAAVGMQLYSFMNSAGWKIDRKTAECLYSAIITDTGSFNYSNTTPEVHEAAAGLIRAGARPAHISSEVYSTTDSSVKLLSAMMSRMRLESGICWSVLTRKMFKRTGAADSETDNFINTLRNVRQARIAVLFKEFGPRTVKVSFRSKTGLDVNYIAKLFDGGGHKYAAGCVVRKPLNKAINTVLAAVRKYYKKKAK